MDREYDELLDYQQVMDNMRIVKNVTRLLLPFLMYATSTKTDMYLPSKLPYLQCVVYICVILCC